jgi:hypothetical protein
MKKNKTPKKEPSGTDNLHTKEIQEILQKAKQASLLPIDPLADFIKNRLPELFPKNLDPTDISLLSKRLYGTSDPEKAIPETFEVVRQTIQSKYIDKLNLICSQKRDELIDNIFLVLCSTIQKLAMAEVEEELAKEHENGLKLDQQLQYPKEIIDEIEKRNQTLTTTAWAEKALKDQGIHTKQLFGVHRGGDHNTKLTKWNDIQTRANFLLYCVILKFYFFSAIDLARRVKPENRINVVGQEYSDKLPEHVIAELCTYPDKNITDKDIENFAYQQAANIVSGEIALTYANNRYFQTRQEFIAGKFDSILEPEATQLLKEYFANNKGENSADEDQD